MLGPSIHGNDQFHLSTRKGFGEGSAQRGICCLTGWEGVAADICRLAGCYLAYFLLCHMCSLAVNIAACYPFQYYSPAITFILPTARRYAAPSVSAAYSLVAYGLVYCKSAHQHVVPHVHSLMCQLSSFCKPTATTDYRPLLHPSVKREGWPARMLEPTKNPEIQKRFSSFFPCCSLP